MAHELQHEHAIITLLKQSDPQTFASELKQSNQQEKHAAEVQ